MHRFQEAWASDEHPQMARRRASGTGDRTSSQASRCCCRPYLLLETPAAGPHALGEFVQHALS